MDIDALDTRTRANEGVEIELKHPETDKPLGIFITVYGADSDAYRDKDMAQQRERMPKVARRGRAAIDPQEMAEEAIELLAASTRGWRNLERKGAALEFSTSAAKSLYTDFPWIRKQVDEAVHRTANFLPKSERN